MKRIWIRIAIVVLVFAAVGAVKAQESGSVTGTVKDNQNAVLAGAQVTVNNASIGISQTVTSNEEGVFIFPQIPPGNYSVTVVMNGFKRLLKTNLVLSSNAKLNTGDLVLELGEVTATVEVTTDTGQLEVQSESGERSDVITNTQLRNIGLNGRNVSDLAKLLPGVISGGPASGNGSSTVNNVYGSFNINGTRSDQHEVTVDGVTNFNLGNNTGALVSVNPDAVAEVKILTSNYQAEFGRAGGGFISITTRGGTNDFHGSGRYFRRHDSLNANNYFSNARGTASSPRPIYRYNFYGFDLGGPVFLPRFGEGGKFLFNGRNRLFFYFNQEYYRQLVPQLTPVNIRVPTAAERIGDFSNTFDGSGSKIYIKDPLLTGTCSAASQAACFPNNIIPANRFYSSGTAILNLFPLPNATGSNYNYSSQVASAYPRRETILRLDGQVNSSTRVSLRFVNNQDDQQFAYGTTTASWNFPLTITDRKNGPGNTQSFQVTKNFGATWINEFIYGRGRGGVTIAPADDKPTRAATGINTPLLYPAANTTGLIPTLAFGTPANSAATATTAVFGPFVQKFKIDNIIDNLTKVQGNHTFKFGLYFQAASNASNSQNAVQGNINFAPDGNNPLNTGYGFANALLGAYTSYTQASVKLNQDNFYKDLSFYVQDSWKIKPRLTLDLGMRFSHYYPYVNRVGPESYFDPSLYNAAQAMRIYRPVCVGASTCSSGQATYRALDPATTGTPTLANTLPFYFVGKLIPNSGNFTNGLGLTTNGYPRGGIDTHFLLPQPRLGFAWDVTGKHTTIIRGGGGITYDRYRSDVTGNSAQNQPFVLNPVLNYGYLQDVTSGGNGALSPSTVRGVDKKGDFPVVYSYSLGVQRQLFGAVFDVSYVGSQSRHLVRTSNLNALPLGTAFRASSQDPTKFAGGVIPASETGLPTAYSAAGLSFSGANSLGVDFLRPYQGFADILYINFDGNSTYNSLQVSANRRFSKGLTFGIAYTFSKVTTTVSDNTTVTSPIDARAYDYAPAAFDRRHFFVANFVWNLPKVGKWVGNNALTNVVLNDWTLSGITTIATGTPTELALTLTGLDAGTRYLGSTATNSGITPRLYLNGAGQNAPNEINIGNFVVPGLNDKGPYPRNYLRQPGINNQDLTLSKNIPFGKEGTRYLQLRVEAFNVFNHTQFSGVNRTTNIVNGLGQQANNAQFFNNYTGLSITNNIRGNGCSATAILGTCFGEYNAARDPRIIQLAAKLYF